MSTTFLKKFLAYPTVRRFTCLAGITWKWVWGSYLGHRFEVNANSFKPFAVVIIN